VILHLVDAYHEDVASAYQTVEAELESYQPELIKRPTVVALTKVEGLDNEIIDDLMHQLDAVTPENTPLFAISAQSGEGLQPLLFTLKEAVQTERAKPAPEPEEPAVPVLRLEGDEAWHVSREGDIFIVTGQKIAQFAQRTDFNNDEAVQRLRDILRRQGIMHELRRQGVEAGSAIHIGGQVLHY
jgi:GTP-binding protein